MTAFVPLSISARIADVLSRHAKDIFGLMGNGNAYFLDAAEAAGLTFHAVRHEVAAVAAADAYYRVSGRLAIATTTYGAGFTNAVTSLAEAARAGIPVVLVAGDAPSAGVRAWDVDQTGLAAAVGVPTFTATADDAGRVTEQAVRHALANRTAVVLAIPYDLATEPVVEYDDGLSPSVDPTPQQFAPDAGALARAAALLAGAKRPLLLAGRGARLSEAGDALSRLAERLGALTAGTALARRFFSEGPRDLGIAGGFGTESAAAIMADADVVLVAGAGLNQFTMRFGQLFGPAATVIQVDVSSGPTHPRVDLFLRGDARSTAEQLINLLPDHRHGSYTWPGVSAEVVTEALHRHAGTGYAGDGRLDPRSVAAALDGLLPKDRVVVQDGGHFIGWAPMFWDVPGPHALNMVGTAFQSIGLGLASAVGAGAAVPESTVVLATGDGGLLMALADLESVIRTVRSGVIVVFNDSAYGAEIHQYGSLGVTEQPMLIPDVDFAGLAQALGAQASTVRSLEDLSAVSRWAEAGAQGVLLLDCKISGSVRAPYMEEVMEAAAAARTAAVSHPRLRPSVT